MEKIKSRLTERDTTQQRLTANGSEGQEYEIDLLELFYRLLENAKYIAVAALIGALLAWSYTVVVVAPKYTATSKLYVLNTGDSAINLSDLQIGNYLASDYQEVFKNWHVHEMVIQRLGLPYSYKTLSKMISVSNPSNTRILYITATSTDPEEAKSIADTYAEVAREFIATTMDTREPNMFEEALRPTSPSSPSKSRNVMVGFMLGFVVACGIITVRYLMDDKIHSSEDVEKYLGIPTLGMLPMQQVKASGSRQRQQKKKWGESA
ncbi:MAG: capsular polysaccharide biosynthesis protein [Clostridia bacterium]|nr:capsular polysaccharide biosynthesis protein [Clostridia bacterium]